MANFVFNVAKGRWAHYLSLPAANDGLVVVPLETAGIEADETLEAHDTLAEILAGTSNEQVTMGRVAITNPLVTVDDVLDVVKGDCDDVSWPAPTGNAISALVVCYDPDVAVGDDTTLIPITKQDFVTTPNGEVITAVINAEGFVQAVGE